MPSAIQRSSEFLLVDSASPPDLGRWVHRKEKFERSVIVGACCFIFISEHPGVGPETGSLQNNKEAPIPGISVSKEDGEFLKRLMARKRRTSQTDTLKQQMSMNRAPLGTSSRILPGHENADEMVIVGCHYDGHDISQGAVRPCLRHGIRDRSRPCAIGLCRGLAETYRPIHRFWHRGIGLTARFVTWRHRSELDNIRFMLNMDAAGGRKP